MCKYAYKCVHMHVAARGPHQVTLSLVLFIYLLSKERLLIDLKLTVSARTAPESSGSHP